MDTTTCATLVEQLLAKNIAPTVTPRTVGEWAVTISSTTGVDVLQTAQTATAHGLTLTSPQVTFV